MIITRAPSNTEIIFCQAVGTNFTGSTTKTTLASVALPAGLIGPNTSIEIECSFGFSSSANGKTVDVALGPTSSSTSTIWSRTRSTVGQVAEAPKITVSNRGVLNSQVVPYGANSSYGSGLTLAPSTMSVDFSVDQVLWFFGTTANAADTIRLDSATVKLYFPRR